MSATSLSLEQFAALSDEIAALSRAGVPLDSGLRALSLDMPGRVGQLARQLGKSLAEGQSLDQAVAEELGASLPPAYRTVIAAGQRAGRLPAALEEVANTARQIAELRRTIGFSLVCPLIVLAIGWGCFLFVIRKILPVLLRAMSEFEMPVASLERAAAVMRDWEPVWSFLIPLVVVAWLAILWYRSGRAARGIDLPRWFSFGAVGTLYRMQRAARLASLAELLALLLRNRVPLHEAVELASGALGSRRLADSGRVLAHRLRQGERIDAAPAGFPPVIAWMLASPWPGNELAAALQHSAQVYRYEFQRRGRWLVLYVPLVLVGVVGGLTVAMYAFLTLGPWIAIMHRLTQPF